MKKKLLSLLLVLAMALTLFPTAVFALEDTEEPLPAAQSEAEEPESTDPTEEAASAENPATGAEDAQDPSDGQAPDNAEVPGDTEDPGNTEVPGENPGGEEDPPATQLTLVPAVPATCTETGTGVYYKDSNGNLFADEAGLTPISTPPSIPALGHLWAASFQAADITSSQHIYHCTRENCNATRAEAHVFESGTCKVCGFVRDVPPSPSRYVDITDAYVNRYSITITWASSLSEGTAFDLYVDGSCRASNVRPSRSSSGRFTYTVDYPYYLSDGYYSIAVYLANDHTIYDTTRVYNRYYDWDWDDHYYPTYNPAVTPDTNSYGIPYASQVTGRYSASEAIRILRNTNDYNLQRDLMSSNSALDSFESLERAVKNANSVSVSVDVDRSDVPYALRSGISISGAAFNASRTNSTVRLVVDGPSQTRNAGRGYQFSMTLTGVDSARSLDVPVVVEMPLPSDINSNYVQVLHYHDSSTPTVIVPKVSGRTISFPLTGFSDFVITDNGTYYGYPYGYPYGYAYVPNGYVGDGYGGYVYVGTAPSSPRRNIVDEHLQIILPILASTPPNGYVYDDVSGTYWASTPIAWAKDIGIMSGYFDGTFRPESGATRQDLWMVLARLAGARPADMEAARQWAISAGISDGTNQYAPLSCQQMITMLYRYARYRGMDTSAPTNNLAFYRDGSAVSPYARTAMSWAANWGIVVPDGDRCLNPENIATRADFATYLYRLLG